MWTALERPRVKSQAEGEEEKGGAEVREQGAVDESRPSTRCEENEEEEEEEEEDWHAADRKQGPPDEAKAPILTRTAEGRRRATSSDFMATV